MAKRLPFNTDYCLLVSAIKMAKSVPFLYLGYLLTANMQPLGLITFWLLSFELKINKIKKL